MRAAPGGLRNEPMMALLLRLALRAGKSPGCCWTTSPGARESLPSAASETGPARFAAADVGGPLARYLRDGRPAGTARGQVFLALDAPHAPVTHAAVTSVACRALRNAGISVTGAAHLLRHTAACGVLAGGGALAEAGELLRHDGPQVTAVYARSEPGRAAVDSPALAGRRRTAVSTDLRAAIAGHLAGRRARGYRLEGRERLLGAFPDSLDARGQTRITVPAAITFATAPAAADPVPGGLIPGRTARRVPYLYSGEETARLMAAAGTLPSPVLAASMRTLIGLLASTTGVRSGEAFALDVGDLDTEAQVLTVTGKYGRKRLIALHSSAAGALSDYLRFREQHAADGTTALFIGQAGRRLGRSVAYPAFRSLTAGCGLEPQPGCRSPRLHDFRHSFRRQHPHRRTPPGP